MQLFVIVTCFVWYLTSNWGVQAEPKLKVIQNHLILFFKEKRVQLEHFLNEPLNQLNELFVYPTYELIYLAH